MDPFLAAFAHHVPARVGRLDVGAMRAAAALLRGTHDLTAFTKVDPSRAGRLRPVKTIHRLDIAAGPEGCAAGPLSAPSAALLAARQQGGGSGAGERAAVLPGHIAAEAYGGAAGGGLRAGLGQRTRDSRRPTDLGG